jgi:light-regulated signal transduction histidine kinase (bacteriophytochrome)
VNYSSEELFGKAICQIMHDIRNSLNIIIGYSSLIQTDEINETEIKEYYNKILQSGTIIEKLLSYIDDYIIKDLDITYTKFDIVSETKSFFSEILALKNDINVQIDNLGTDPMQISTSLELYKKLLDNLYHFSLKELRNKENKFIQIIFTQDKNNLIILYSDSSSPIYITNKYFTFEEIIDSKRGLSLIFIEKYAELLKSSLEYYYGNKWHNLISKYSKKNSSHGFIIKFPFKKDRV